MPAGACGWRWCGARRLLKSDGLVDGRQGAGIFVRSSDRLIREPHEPLPLPWERTVRRYWPHGFGLPSSPGVDSWTHAAEEICADSAVAQRLALIVGDAVLQTTNCYTDGGLPLQLIISWQPVRSRFADGITRLTDELTERVSVRPASMREITELALPARGSVLAVSRTYTRRGVPVEVADIVMPAERWELVYRVPLD